MAQLKQYSDFSEKNRGIDEAKYMLYNSSQRHYINSELFMQAEPDDDAGHYDRFVGGLIDECKQWNNYTGWRHTINSAEYTAGASKLSYDVASKGLNHVLLPTDEAYRILNNTNIINQQGLFIYNSHSSTPLEQMYIEHVATLKEELPKKLSRQAIDDLLILDNFASCLNIHKSLIPYIKTKLSERAPALPTKSRGFFIPCLPMAADLVTILETVAVTQLLTPTGKALGETILERGKQMAGKAAAYLATVGRQPQTVAEKLLVPMELGLTYNELAISIDELTRLKLCDANSASFVKMADPAKQLRVVDSVYPTSYGTEFLAAMNKESLFELIRSEEVTLWAGAGLSLYADYPSGRRTAAILYESFPESFRSVTSADTFKLFMDYHELKADLRIADSGFDISGIQNTKGKTTGEFKLSFEKDSYLQDAFANLASGLGHEPLTIKAEELIDIDFRIEELKIPVKEQEDILLNHKGDDDANMILEETGSYTYTLHNQEIKTDIKRSFKFISPEFFENQEGGLSVRSRGDSFLVTYSCSPYSSE
nr:hypothetical protein [Tanacetum cinerariifolium]